MDISFLLDQNEAWVDKEGKKYLLKEMSCSYKANVLAFIIRNRENFVKLYLSRCEQLLGSAEGLREKIEKLGEEEWLWTRPLVIELHTQSSSPIFDGPVR